MRTYSAAEANTHFEEVLDRVRSGETIILTENGEALAEIVPATANSGLNIDSLAKLDQVRKLFKGITLDEMIAARHEGHRY